MKEKNYEFIASNPSHECHVYHYSKVNLPQQPGPLLTCDDCEFWSAIAPCLTQRAVDLVVGRAKLRSSSESIFRFDAWFAHQAANASR